MTFGIDDDECQIPIFSLIGRNIYPDPDGTWFRLRTIHVAPDGPVHRECHAGAGTVGGKVHRHLNILGYCLLTNGNLLTKQEG